MRLQNTVICTTGFLEHCVLCIKTRHGEVRIVIAQALYIHSCELTVAACLMRYIVNTFVFWIDIVIVEANSL